MRRPRRLVLTLIRVREWLRLVLARCTGPAQRRQALGDCEKPSTNTSVLLHFSTSRHELAEMNSIRTGRLRCKARSRSSTWHCRWLTESEQAGTQGFDLRAICSTERGDQKAVLQRRSE